MRSNTLTPLLQIAKWLGIEPYSFNGIDYDGSGLVPPRRLENHNNCECVLQHPWMSKANFTRDDFIAMIDLAEQVFIRESGIHPAPVQVLGEVHDLPKLNYRSRKLSPVSPRYDCEFNEFGVYSLYKVATVELIRTGNDGLISDNFKWFLQLPSNYNNIKPEQLAFYFGENDCEVHTDYNVKSCEIRPVTDIVIMPDGSVTAKAPAYLFKKPILDEADNCVPHELATYVETIDVYLRVNDYTQQGCFWCKQSPCTSVPCKDKNYPLCFSVDPIGYSQALRIQAFPIPARPLFEFPFLINGNVEVPLVHYQLCCEPKYLTMNYVTGKRLDHGYICSDIFEILIRLGIGLMDCIREWCKCSACFKDKLEYWREVEKVKIAEGAKEGVIGDQYKVLVTDKTLDLLNGLPPYRGVTFAMREIGKFDCSDNVTGGMFG